MAIATTLLTGPLLSLIQRAARAPDADPVRRAPRRPHDAARSRRWSAPRDTARP